MNWDELIESASVDEVQNKSAVVVDEPTSGLIAMLTRLRQPGPTGGRQRATLPVKSHEDFQRIRATLQAGARKLDPPASVTCKATWADADLVTMEEKGEDGTVIVVTEPREGAIPTGIRFSVGEKRGAKAKVDTVATVTPVKAAKASGGRKAG